MPPVFLYCKKSATVKEIEEHGLPLGAMKHSEYGVRTELLEKGDVLLLLSDGMPELQNEKNEMYGYERIRDGFKRIAKKEPEDIINFFKNECSSWVNNQDPDDDVTFVVIKVK